MRRRRDLGALSAAPALVLMGAALLAAAVGAHPKSGVQGQVAPRAVGHSIPTARAHPEGIALIRAVAPTSSRGFAALLMSSRLWTLTVFDSTGAENWVYAFQRNEVPSSVATSGDTIGVTLGSGDSFELVRFRVGQRGLLSRVRILGVDDPYAMLVPSAGAGFMLQENTAARNAQPTIELSRFGSSGLEADPFLRVIDSTPRAVVRGGPASRPTETAYRQPWVPPVILAAAKDEVFIGGGISTEIRVMDRTGLERRRLPMPGAARTITAADKATWMTQWRERAGRGASADGAASVSALPSPPVLPPVHGLFTSADAGLAVVRGDRDPNPVLPGDSVFVDVLGADGRVRWSGGFAPGTQLRSFTGSALILSRIDSSRRVPRGDAAQPELTAGSVLLLHRITSGSSAR